MVCFKKKKKKKRDNNNRELRKRLFVGFSRQEYWSGLPFPSPGDHMLSWGCKESDTTELTELKEKTKYRQDIMEFSLNSPVNPLQTQGLFFFFGSWINNYMVNKIKVYCPNHALQSLKLQRIYI